MRHWYFLLWCWAGWSGMLLEAVAEGRVLRDLPYLDGGDAKHRLDLYLPDKAEASGAVFLYIHGGAWVSGDKSRYESVGKAMAGDGIATAVINYRLTRPGKTTLSHPDHINDCAAAYAWLRRHASEHGLNPSAIFVGGHSAGAHMAALMVLDKRYLDAVGETSTAVAGVIALEGIYDIPALVKRYRQYERQFIGPAFGAKETDWRAASPATYVRAVPVPWLVIHSPLDELVNLGQSKQFVKALRAVGNRCAFFVKVNDSHFGVVSKLKQPKNRVRQAMTAFVREHASKKRLPNP